MMNSVREEITHMIRRQQVAWNRGDAAGYAADYVFAQKVMDEIDQ